MRLKNLVALACGVFVSTTAWGAARTEAQLILSAAAAQSGETIFAGVRLHMPAGWHTYWRNAGDAGGPTAIAWTLPPGVTAGEILWPVPEKLVDNAANLTTYTYSDDVVLLVPLSVGADAAKGPLPLKAKVSWLECEKLCLPGRAEVSATLTVGAESKPSPQAAMIETARKSLPQTKGRSDTRAWWEAGPQGDSRSVVLEWSADGQTSEADFFPFGSDKFTVKPPMDKVTVAGGKVHLRKTVEKLEGDWPAQFGGLLIEREAGGKLLGAYEVTLPISGSASKTSIRSESTAVASDGSGGSLFVNLVLALVGGLILNLMPCVLPVIALKILGFVNQSAGSPVQVRKLGLIYGAGVLVSLLVLAGFVIGVQKAGRLASWGMQFQNPQFVVAITTLVTLVALNLFGVFEVTLSGGAMGAAGDLAAKEGASGAFFNGVLAVVLATPCTAPFLGLALGYAFSQPPTIIALTFAMVAIGLASPYVVLSFFPQWLRFLPKPGVWMEKFKMAMGFPMLATAMWLLTLASPHFGTRGVLWVGLFLVTVACAAWVWGQFVQRSSKRKGLAVVVCLALLALGYGYALEKELHWRTPAQRLNGSGAAASLKEGADGIDWQPWSAAAVKAAQAEGRPVLVDFTADWCVTCQANKKTSLEISSVRQKIKEIKAVPLLGDYTREDPAITEELKRFKRAGVPLVLVYAKDASKEPIVLPALLTPSTVLDALDKAVK
jgi:thiol:disulfide interchange protein/DsbC/DsbD-like thiol-disulfide interchange protein